MVHGTLLSGMSTMVVMPPAAAADVAVTNPADPLGLRSECPAAAVLLQKTGDHLLVPPCR